MPWCSGPPIEIAVSRVAMRGSIKKALASSVSPPPRITQEGGRIRASPPRRLPQRRQSEQRSTDRGGEVGPLESPDSASQPQQPDDLIDLDLGFGGRATRGVERSARTQMRADDGAYFDRRRQQEVHELNQPIGIACVVVVGDHAKIGRDKSGSGLFVTIAMWRQDLLQEAGKGE